MAVARALEDGEHLAVEAGTGVGKSLAYLVPAILYRRGATRRRRSSPRTPSTCRSSSRRRICRCCEQILPVQFSFTMLKGRANYLCTRRLHKAMQQAGNLFTSSEAEELQRIYEWSKTTTDGSLSDFEVEPDPKVWAQVCSERGLCSPKICGHPSDFAKDHGVCFFQRARNRILSSDVLVLNHTLFFTLLGGLEEETRGRHPVQERLRDLRRGAPDGKRGLEAHRAERLERPDALRPAPAVESAHRERACWPPCARAPR